MVFVFGGLHQVSLASTLSANILTLLCIKSLTPDKCFDHAIHDLDAAVFQHLLLMLQF